MVRTRGQKKARSKKIYRRLKNSPCRGKGPAVCRSLKGCKYASSKKRNYCRKSSNRSLKLNNVNKQNNVNKKNNVNKRNNVNKKNNMNRNNRNKTNRINKFTQHFSNMFDPKEQQQFRKYVLKNYNKLVETNVIKSFNN